MPRPSQNFLFAIHVGLDHFDVVECEGQRIEHLGRAELGIALENALHAGSSRVEGPEAPDWHARADHVRAAAEHVFVHANVRMGHENNRKLHGRAKPDYISDREQAPTLATATQKFFCEPSGRSALYFMEAALVRWPADALRSSC